MEAIVDAHGGEEQTPGWYYYLEARLQFPFKAKCIEARKIPSLKESRL
jgi:hypothetical protein